MMQTIMSNDIPCIFSAYGISIGEGYNESIGKMNKIVRRNQYWCSQCHTSFIVDHNYHGAIGNFSGFNDTIVYCPGCGHRHENWWKGPHYIYYFHHNEESVSVTKTAPLTANISLHEGNEVIILRAKFKTIRFIELEYNNDRYGIEIDNRREEFRFNVKTGKAEFVIRSNRPCIPTIRYNIGNPFDMKMFEDSLLQQICSSNHSEKCASGTVHIMKTLRERIQKKWKAFHGYDLKSIYVGGRLYGRMLFQLLNIAYRLSYSDVGNLPSFFNHTPYTRLATFAEKVITGESAAKYGDLERIRQGPDSVSAIIKLFDLPDKPLIRKKIGFDIFVAAELSEVFKITRNPDYAKTIWNLMQKKSRVSEWHQWSTSKRTRAEGVLELYKFLQMLSSHYPVSSIIAFIRHFDWVHLTDTRKLFERLLPERQEILWQENVKLKDLHDWLIQATKHQRDQGFDLKVPEHVRKRLTMQLDQLHFFLPEHSRELQEIGDELHNCVRTYDERMRMQKCNIVPVTDDNGKLVACLEVTGDKLVQAKLKHNKPVSEDGLLNKEIIKWAEKVGLSIKTKDILVTPQAEKTLPDERAEAV